MKTEHQVQFRRLWVTVAASCVLACGSATKDSDTIEADCDPLNSECQMVPAVEEPMTANGKADYTCLTKATLPEKPTKDLVLRGVTQQRDTSGKDKNIGRATVEIWIDQTKLDDATRLAKTESDENGNFEITIPVSAWAQTQTSWAVVAFRVSHPDTIPTTEVNSVLEMEKARPDPQDSQRLILEGIEINTVTPTTLQLSLALVGATNKYQEEAGILWGRVKDCHFEPIANASAGVVDPDGKPAEGPLLYFAKSKVPMTRKQQRYTSADGQFTFINVPFGKQADVRVVGTIAGKRTLLSRLVLPVQSKSVIAADFTPLTSPFEQ